MTPSSPFEPSDVFVEGVRTAALRCDGDATLVALTDRLVIGRSSRCDLVLSDASISGRHAAIAWGNGTWTVRDLGSRNGTRVDGTRLIPGAERALGSGSLLEFGIDDRVWRLIDDRAPSDHSLRRPDLTMMTVTMHKPVALAQASFQFTVSADEEHVSWTSELDADPHALGDRSYVYLLLTLARQRQRDADLPLGRRGWVVADDLARRLDMSPETMKVHVYRARQALRSLDIIGANGIVERRAATNQIRFGSDRVQIEVV